VTTVARPVVREIGAGARRLPLTITLGNAPDGLALGEEDGKERNALPRDAIARHTTALPALACSVLGAVAASAQPAEPSPRGAIDVAVEVRVVEVDVVVLDRRGRPVTGLGPADFRLEEDGRPVEITYFAAPVARDAGAGSASAPSASPAEAAPAGVTPGLDRAEASLVFLLDERLLQPAARRRALEGLRPFLEENGAAFERLVFARYRDRLELVEPATPEAILGALADRGPLAVGAARSRDLTRAIDGMITSDEACANMPVCVPCYDNWGELLDHARQYSYAEEVRAALAVDAVAELASWLGGLEGEKLLLYPSEALPHRPGIEALTFVLDLCSGRRSEAENEIAVEMLQLDESRRYRDLGAWANARGVRLFALEATGLPVASAASVEYSSIARRPSQRFDEVLRRNAQSGLYQLADETGGKAVFNTNDPLGDVDLAPELAARYSLGFVPAHPPSGRRHELRVEVLGGRGRELRYRRSYIDRTLEQRLADELQSVLRLGLERDALGAGVAFGEIAAGDGADEIFEVPVRLTLAADRLLGLPGATGGGAGAEVAAQGRLRVWLGALRDDGTPTALRQEQFRLGAGGLEPVEGRYEITVTMPLTAGRWTVAVGVRDELAQQTSLLRGVVEVGAAASAAPDPP
jgi:VWFA-related protein